MWRAEAHQLKNKAKGPWFSVAVCVLHTPLHWGRRERMTAIDFCEWLDHYSRSKMTSDCISGLFRLGSKRSYFNSHFAIESFDCWVIRAVLLKTFHNFLGIGRYSFPSLKSWELKMKLCINFFGYPVSVSFEICYDAESGIVQPGNSHIFHKRNPNKT